MCFLHIVLFRETTPTPENEGLELTGRLENSSKLNKQGVPVNGGFGKFDTL